MKIGIGSGFQWLDGSFLENVEMTEKRDPGDLDLVTFFRQAVHNFNSKQSDQIRRVGMLPEDLDLRRPRPR